MPIRKEPLYDHGEYHIYNKSIAGFIIFNHPQEYQRFLYMIRYYQYNEPREKFSWFLKSRKTREQGFSKALNDEMKNNKKIVEISAFCLMPTHFHFILKGLTPEGISIFIGKICNAYTRFFNTLHKRKGPLWQSRFNNKWIQDNNYREYLINYIHQNPVKAGLVFDQKNWPYSSASKPDSTPGVESGSLQFYRLSS